MTRITITICLALLLGITAACGSGREVCSRGYDYYYDSELDEYVYYEYEDCYDDPYYYKPLHLTPATFPIIFVSDDGYAEFWALDHEAMISGGLLEFQADAMERGLRPLPPASELSDGP